MMSVQSEVSLEQLIIMKCYFSAKEKCNSQSENRVHSLFIKILTYKKKSSIDEGARLVVR
jgi:hypothetical protein